LQDVTLDGRIVAKRALRKKISLCELDLSESEWISVAGSCKNGNESFGYINARGCVLIIQVNVSLSEWVLLHGIMDF
jgi:hypothetical protein